MPYVTHNVILESACQAYHAQFGMATTRFRCAWIYGVHPEPEKSVWRALLEEVRAGKVCESTFGCDVVAVQDVAAALVASVGNPAAFGQVFNLCDAFVYQRDLARLAGEAIDVPAKVTGGGLPMPGPIRSEKVRALGVDVHRGPEGIRGYFSALNRVLR
jgi:nucleoside-diphosphate-sugar epimerase